MGNLNPNVWIARLIAVAVVIGAIAFAVINYGNGRYQEGKDEIQALWDKDKADRKADADRQAKETADKNKGNEDALRKAQDNLRDARGNLNVALERLRDLPVVPGEGYLPLAGGDCPKASVPGMAGDSSGLGIRVEQRIGSCEGTGSEPCFVSRSFFGQALNDAQDRGLTRQWAAGQGIKTIAGGEK